MHLKLDRVSPLPRRVGASLIGVWAFSTNLAILVKYKKLYGRKLLKYANFADLLQREARRRHQLRQHVQDLHDDRGDGGADCEHVPILWSAKVIKERKINMHIYALEMLNILGAKGPIS